MLKKYFLLSLGVHLFLILNALLYFSHQTLPNINNNKISTYIYSTHAAASQHVTTSNQRIPAPMQISKRPSLQRSLLKPPPLSSSLVKSRHPDAHKEKNEIERDKNILQLLHNAIAENQTYPEPAMALNQTGTVKIGFNLHPDGRLTNIQIVSSSGFTSLDNAAIATIIAISPLPTARYYLEQIRYFTVEVTFS